jgi:hypothetical protein
VKSGHRRSIGELDISVDGDKIPLTLRGLASCHLSADILHNIRKCVTGIGARRLRRLKRNGARRSMEHSTERTPPNYFEARVVQRIQTA